MSTTIDVSNLNAAELDALIERAATARAAMEPPVADQPPATMQAIFNPGWRLLPIPQGCLLSLKHPGYGWLSFILPPNDRAGMLTVMLAQALQPAPATADAGVVATPNPPAGSGRSH